jgi:hypothetical protein
VFSGDGGFRSVHHLNEDVNNNENGYRNVVENSGHATGTGMSLPAETGIIHRAAAFDGVDDYIDTRDLSMNQARGTVLLWARTPPVFSGNPVLRLAFGNREQASGDRVYLGHDASGVLAARLDASDVFGGHQLAVDTWYHMALVWRTDGTGEVYVDGASKGAVSGLTFDSTITVDAGLGSYQEGTDSFWEGLIDEARISSVDRSPQWIKLSYENQKPRQRLVYVTPTVVPVVTVDNQVTMSLSPIITGTVSDVNASVEITIRGDTFPATVDPDGNWSITEYTFPGLVYGKNDVQASATNDAGTGTDNTVDELIVIPSEIAVSFPDLRTNDPTPDLHGIINDPTASLSVTVGNRTHAAVNNEDSTWTLTGDSLDIITSDTVQVAVTAVNLLGSRAHGTGMIIMDVSAPVLDLLDPAPGKKVTQEPRLLIILNEVIYQGTGNILLKQFGVAEPVEEIPVNSDKVNGGGMEHLKIHPSTILTPGVSYYLVIPPTCIRDAAGNYFAGFPDSTGWWFTVRSEDDPIVDSIVSLIPAGLYKMRDTITFAIHFSHPITLSTGKLNVVLETGEIEQTVSTSPFSSRSSITMDYIVQYGDHTDESAVFRAHTGGADKECPGRGPDHVYRTGQESFGPYGFAPGRYPPGRAGSPSSGQCHRAFSLCVLCA